MGRHERDVPQNKDHPAGFLMNRKKQVCGGRERLSVVSVLQVTVKRNTPEEMPERGFWGDASVCLQTSRHLNMLEGKPLLRKQHITNISPSTNKHVAVSTLSP